MPLTTPASSDDFQTDDQYREIVKRLPEETQREIEVSLGQVTPEQLALLQSTIDKPEKRFDDGSFIYEEMFVPTALMAVREGIISNLQFGTLMNLWGYAKQILTQSGSGSVKKPEFIPLLLDNGKMHPLAAQYLIIGTQPPISKPDLFDKDSSGFLKGIFENAKKLPCGERGFWIVPRFTQTSSKINIIGVIKGVLGFHILDMPKNDEEEIIPSLSLYQLFLNTAFNQPVKINPVMGESTVDEIRKNSLDRIRDIAIPCLWAEQPTNADGFEVSNWWEFTLHDLYHSVRASRLSPEETIRYIAFGDRFKAMQQRLENALKTYSKLHNRNIDNFKNSVITEPGHQAIVLKVLYREHLIISVLKRLRKTTGMIKFSLYDMEHNHKNTTIEEPIMALHREIKSVLEPISFFGLRPGTPKLSLMYGRIIAHALLDAISPDEKAWCGIREKLRKEGGPAFFPGKKEHIKGFYFGIMDGGVTLPDDTGVKLPERP